MLVIAGLIDDVLKDPESQAVSTRTRESAKRLCADFPLYPARVPAIA